jgi:putative NADPH-quinone reductase
VSDAAGGGTLILLGSARSNGDTARAAEALAAQLGPEPATLLDLGARSILPFDYGNPAPADDFGTVADLMLAHRAIVFATPVYWYAMSGVIKTFFDRFSDLLSGRDPERRGRGLAGREVWLLVVGTDPALPAGFELPFARTAEYLAMDWSGAFYVRSGKATETNQIARLAEALRSRAEARKS